MRVTLGPICRLLPSLADSWVGSLTESVLCAGLMVQDEEHLLKVADGRIKSPEIDVHQGEWLVIQPVLFRIVHLSKWGNAVFVKAEKIFSVFCEPQENANEQKRNTRPFKILGCLCNSFFPNSLTANLHPCLFYCRSGSPGGL